MTILNKVEQTVTELLIECELDNIDIIEYYKECKVFELPPRNQNESKMYLFVEGSTIENVICDKNWWDVSMATESYAEYFNEVLIENNLAMGY